MSRAVVVQGVSEWGALYGVVWQARAFGEDVLQGVVAVCLEVIGYGGDAVEVSGQEDRKGEIAERDIVGGAVSGSRQAGVLVEGGISTAVISVLDRPVPAAGGEEVPGGGPFVAEGADSVSVTDGYFAGLDVLSLPGDAEHLLRMGGK